MKAKFYYVKDLYLYINLEQLTSFQRKQAVSNPTIPYKCVLVVGKSIYWCDEVNFFNLKELI